MFLEWTDPPFAPGHWIPEMVEAAGGAPPSADRGEVAAVTWAQVRRRAPDLVVVAPCGFDRAGPTPGPRVVAAGLPPGLPVRAVDANAELARPGPRLVDGSRPWPEACPPGAVPLPAGWPHSSTLPPPPLPPFCLNVTFKPLDGLNVTFKQNEWRT